MTPYILIIFIVGISGSPSTDHVEFGTYHACSTVADVMSGNFQKAREGGGVMMYSTTCAPKYSLEEGETE